MKRPAFQFYPGDWQANSNLRRCTHAEKGVWLDVMCLMHDSEEYGVLRWSLKEIAQAVGCKVADLKALKDKGVMKGADKGEPCEPFIYTPRSGRKDGEPVTLVALQDGPIWYSSRMVRDEYVRKNAGAWTRFGKQDEPPSLAPNDSPSRSPSRRQGEVQGDDKGERQSDGSSSSSSINNLDTAVTALPPVVNARAPAFAAGELTKPMLGAGIRANPGHPDIVALAQAGCNPNTVQAAIDEAKRVKGDGGITQGYVVAILKRWQADPLTVKPRTPQPENFEARDYGTGGRF